MTAPMKKTFRVSYDSIWDLMVEINQDPTTLGRMSEMVLFWSSGEELLQEAGGDVTKAFLKHLGQNLLRLAVHATGTAAVEFLSKQEGWYKLDGSDGIKVTTCDEYGFDDDLFEIDEVDPVTGFPLDDEEDEE